MADELSRIVEVECDNCGSAFLTEKWESDDDTIVLECPKCLCLVHWDGSVFAEVV